MNTLFSDDVCEMYDCIKDNLYDFFDEYEQDNIDKLSDEDIWNRAYREIEYQMDEFIADLSYVDRNICGDILVIGDLGFWNGRSKGFKFISKLSDIIYTDCDINKFFFDDNKILNCDCSHHDGSNHYTYYICKDKDAFENALYFENKSIEDCVKEFCNSDCLYTGFAEYYGW